MGLRSVMGVIMICGSTESGPPETRVAKNQYFLHHMEQQSVLGRFLDIPESVPKTLRR